MDAIWARLRRALRALLDEATPSSTRRALDEAGVAFRVDFTSRAAVLALFEEGSGSLLTDGSRACMEPSHLLYDAPIDEAGHRGLVVLMDDQDVSCGHEAEIAVGHLASRQLYAYGDFEWIARVHHSPDGGPPPENSFACFSTFVHGDQAHNELAWCFPSNDGSEVHMSYWYDDVMHRTAMRLRVDLSKGFHKYTTRWRERGVDWLIDDVLVHQTRGTAGVDLPWELMSIRVIIRPRNKPSVFLGAARMELARLSYTPVGEMPVGAQASTRRPVSADTPPPPWPPPPPSPKHAPPPPRPSPPQSLTDLNSACVSSPLPPPPPPPPPPSPAPPTPVSSSPTSSAISLTPVMAAPPLPTASPPPVEQAQIPAQLPQLAEWRTASPLSPSPLPLPVEALSPGAFQPQAFEEVPIVDLPRTQGNSGGNILGGWLPIALFGCASPPCDGLRRRHSS